MFAFFEKIQKEKKKKRKRSHSDSDSSDSDWSESLVGRKRDSEELFTRDSLGIGISDHLLDPVVNGLDTNNISNDSISNENLQLQLNELKRDIEYLKNNLFVYNKSSCPVRLRKYIREQLEFSPEVAAILLPDVVGAANKKKKKDGKWWRIKLFVSY